MMGKKLTRRELLSTMCQATAFSPLLGLAVCQTDCGRSSIGSSSPPPSDGFPGSDDDLLDQIERAAFLFFWEQADPTTGQVKDRALAEGNDTRTVSSIAATGFGLTALCIADRRGYRPRAELTERVRRTLGFLVNQMPSVHGFFYHFVDMTTGARAFNSEVSSIDTAILLCGVLTCRKYFPDGEIATLATQLYERVDWNWMRNSGRTVSMGWYPEKGFLKDSWNRYCELMMIYLLGMGSPTHPLPAASWDAFSRPLFEFHGLKFISIAAPLFVHQYSHAWFDFRNKRDKYADYFQNSMLATKAHKLFCIGLHQRFPDYSEKLWGITASDSVQGYVAWGGPPPQGPIDGTLVPCAPGGSIPFLPKDTLEVLRNMRALGDKVWKRYGFIDAFNPLTGWYNADVIGINLGITVLMAENARTGFIWQTFMQNQEARHAMSLAGFR